jgi:hypothetical protein
MTGSCWRLLAAFLLIFVAALLLAQDAADRSPVPAPNWRATPNSGLGAWYRPPLFPIPPQRYPVASNALAFEQMARVAGIIFSGRVTSIGHSASFSGKDPPSTTVTFQVEQALRGTSPGQSLTIHEWAGLWNNGERYHVGERVLLLLYSPSKLGLTSPVGGTMGRFAMDSRGRIVMNPQHLAVLSPDPILGGKTFVPYADFAMAVRRSRREE